MTAPRVRWADLRFPLLLAAWAVGLGFLGVKALQGEPMQALAAGTAQGVVVGSSLTGLPATAIAGTVVSFGGGAFSFQVTEGCTAWAPAVLFVAAVLAYPATGRQRLLGVLAGLPLLLGLNLARLVALGWIGVRVPRLFTQAHELWMQAFIILAVALSWIVWARHVDAPRRDAARPRPAREVGKSVLLFVAVVAVAEALGVWAGLVGLYGFIVKTEAVAVLGLLGVRHGGLGGFVDFGLYGSLAGTVALYLATPGVPLRVRMAAAGWWGFVVQVMFHVVVAVALAWMTAGQVEGELTWVGVSFLAMGGPAGIWLLWVRRQRAERSPAGDGAQDFADPA